MTVVVYIVGLMLVLLGAVFIWIGVPVVRMEIGWSEVIGGSVATSAGFVVLALGVVISRLERLHRSVVGLSLAPAWRDSFADPEPVWDEPAPPSPDPVLRSPAPPFAGAAADTVPAAMFFDEPRVEPEPPIAEAPLHLEDVEPVAGPEPAVDLARAAPADLLPPEDQAPPIPPVEAVPREDLPPAEPGEPPEVPPPQSVLGDGGRPRPNFLAAFLARRTAATSAASPGERFHDPSGAEPSPSARAFEHDEAPAPTPVDLSSGWGEPEPSSHMPSGTADDPVGAQPTHPEEPDHQEAEERETAGTGDIAHDATAAEPEAVHEAEPGGEAEPPPVRPEETVASRGPVVVGRYNAGSASYVMYSNGMIEVETESGTHQFASMQELKTFIERRDAAKV